MYGSHTMEPEIFRVLGRGRVKPTRPEPDPETRNFRVTRLEPDPIFSGFLKFFKMIFY